MEAYRKLRGLRNGLVAKARKVTAATFPNKIWGKRTRGRDAISFFFSRWLLWSCGHEQQSSARISLGETDTRTIMPPSMQTSEVDIFIIPALSCSHSSSELIPLVSGIYPCARSVRMKAAHRALASVLDNSQSCKSGPLVRDEIRWRLPPLNMGGRPLSQRTALFTNFPLAYLSYFYTRCR